MLSRRCFGALLAVAIVAGAAPAAEAPGVRVERISGPAVTAQRLVSMTAQKLTVGGTTGEASVSLGEVVSIAFDTAPDPPVVPRPADVAVDLWSGEVLHGEISTGDDKTLTVAAPLLGKVAVPLEQLAGVRFLHRLAQVADPPDLRSVPDADVLHLAGGDRVVCTVESFGATGVTYAAAGSPKREVAYDALTALRLIAAPPPKPTGTAVVAVLRDATRLVGSAPTVAEGRLRLRSVSEFDASVMLADVIAIHVLSDAVAYLSDLPSEVVVKPFWETVAGKPEVLYAPHMDRSYLGGPLRSGGRTWVKGIGVYAGTSLTWDLGGRWSELRTWAGIDDATGPLGSVVFEVLVDGESKWKSDLVLRDGERGRGTAGPVDAGRIPLAGAKRLTLRVAPGDAEDPYPIQDHADWLGAMLVR